MCVIPEINFTLPPAVSGSRTKLYWSTGGRRPVVRTAFVMESMLLFTTFDFRQVCVLQGKRCTLTCCFEMATCEALPHFCPAHPSLFLPVNSITHYVACVYSVNKWMAQCYICCSFVFFWSTLPTVLAGKLVACLMHTVDHRNISF